jgi:hypothetical protein
MGAPDDDSSQSTVLSFKRRQIANAAFIQTAAIIDHQHLAGCARSMASRKISTLP